MNCRWISAGVLLPVLFLAGPIGANDDFEAWKKKQNASFKSYLNKEQAAFKRALESDWENFQLAQPKKLFNKPKLDKPPVAPPKPEPDIAKTPVPEPKPEPVPTPDPIPAPEPVPELKPIPQPEPVQPDPVLPVKSNQVEIVYLGKRFVIEELTPSYLPLKADNKVIADAWETLYPDIESIAEALQQDEQFVALSDWAVVSLLDKYAQRVNHKETNGSQLLLWALLLELDYDARLAYDKQNLYVLLASQQKIYGRASLNFDGKDYYILTGEKPNNSLYSYSVSQPSNISFDFSFYDTQPVHGLKAEERTLSDKYTGLSVSYQTYPSLEEYYRYHPLLDFVWYFRVTPQDSQYVQLVNSLRESLNGLSQFEQVAVLLSLIQHGFEYERDQEQWGEEYYSTPMHTLMLDAVDCEDRSFLFSYLVEEVTGLDTVGLKYPGHLAVAVAVDEADMQGKADYVMVGSRKFYVADPTYIGASIGQEMPMYQDVNPIVISKL